MGEGGLAGNHRKRRIPPNWTAKVVLEPKSRGQSYTLFNDFEVVSFGIPNLKFLLLLIWIHVHLWVVLSFHTHNGEKNPHIMCGARICHIPGGHWSIVLSSKCRRDSHSFLALGCLGKSSVRTDGAASSFLANFRLINLLICLTYPTSVINRSYFTIRLKVLKNLNPLPSIMALPFRVPYQASKTEPYFPRGWICMLPNNRAKKMEIDKDLFIIWPHVSYYDDIIKHCD